MEDNVAAAAVEVAVAATVGEATAVEDAVAAVADEVAKKAATAVVV